MANLELLCKELKKCGIPCSLDLDDENETDYDSIIFHIKYLVPAEDKSIKNEELAALVKRTDSDFNIESRERFNSLFNIFYRKALEIITLPEEAIAKDVSEIFYATAKNNGLTIKY